MRILVVGAGGVGGYFGGRLLEAGQDVTFLVRPRRAAELATRGLSIRSPVGNIHRAAPPTVTADAIPHPFDLVLLSCKAYDLQAALATFAPAIGPASTIFPLLNGMRHLDVLDDRFGADRVIGGFCVISADLGPEGDILHLNDLHTIAFGERSGVRTARLEAIASAFGPARVDSRASDAILQEMWEKWVFIATAAGLTCLMRATVGDIVDAGAVGCATALLDECAAVATAEGYPPADASMQRSRAMVTAPGSLLAASMFRDIERGSAIEADHIVGDLLRRGQARGVAAPLLTVAAAHLRSYEARRAREGTGRP